jgi:glycosyltransferase involved in cell wall biosynthesis
VLAGSDHIGRVLAELVDPDPEQVHVVPPGVDVERFRPQERGSALTSLLAECGRDAPNPVHTHDERRPDADNAARLAAFFDGDRRTVLYVGKLSAERASRCCSTPLRGIDARTVIVGFGPSRAELEAAAGRDVLFTGPLEHRHLQHLWPLADVSVTPSVFPEAFGMVAAEAASCGSPPWWPGTPDWQRSPQGWRPSTRSRFRHLASFERGDTDDLTAKLRELLALPHEEWLHLSRAARRAAEQLWSWQTVGDRILQTGTGQAGGA